MDLPARSDASRGNGGGDGGAGGGGGARSRGIRRSEAHETRQHHQTPATPWAQRAWRRFVGVLEMPWHIACLMVQPDDHNVLHGPFLLTGDKRVAWSRPVPLEAVRRAKDHFSAGCSVNDVLLTATTAALSRYIRAATDDSAETLWRQRLSKLPTEEIEAIRRANAREITLAVPFNVRSAEEMARVVLENKFAVVFIPQPLHACGARERLATMVRSMGELKRSSVPLAMFASMQALMRVLPARWAAMVIDSVADSATCIVTNNRGPSHLLRLDGRTCTFWASWAPQRAAVGLCLTVYTYAGTVRCSASADSSCIPDPDRLVSLLMEELEALAELAGWTPSGDEGAAGASVPACP
jgi:hypothetical protein